MNAETVARFSARLLKTAITDQVKTRVSEEYQFSWRPERKKVLDEYVNNRTLSVSSFLVCKFKLN